MALTKLVADLNIHQSKPDKVRGQATATKEYFDKAPNDIKDFINNTLTVESDTLNAQNVKLAGAQSIADVKTFTSSPIVPTPTTDMQTSTKKYVDDTDTARELYVDNLDSANVKKTADQTIAGVKTFTSGPLVPTPTVDMQASTKKYVDDMGANKTNDLTTHKSSADHDGRYYTEAEMDVALNLKANDNEVVHLALDETISGEKTFSKSPIAPTPTSSGQVSTKDYVDTVLADAVLGAIPDNSIGNIKLAPDIQVGSLAALTTIDKTSITSAINENVTEISTKADQTDLDFTNSNIADLLGATDENQLLTYTTGTLTKVTSYQPDGTTLKETQDLAYTSGTLTSAVTKQYNTSGALQSTITETLNYTNGVLISVGRTVA